VIHIDIAARRSGGTREWNRALGDCKAALADLLEELRDDASSQRKKREAYFLRNPGKEEGMENQDLKG